MSSPARSPSFPSAAAAVAPLAVPATSFTLPTNGITFTAAHLKTLLALADTFLSPMPSAEARAAARRFGSSPAHARDVLQFCAMSGAETDAVPKLVAALNDPTKFPRYLADQLALGVQLLSTTWGTFLLTGYTSAFAALSRADRAAAVSGMLTSALELRRSLAHGLRCLVCIIAVSSVTPPDSVAPKGISPPRTRLHPAVNGASLAFAPFGHSNSTGNASAGASSSALAPALVPLPGTRTNAAYAAMGYPGPDPAAPLAMPVVHAHGHTADDSAGTEVTVGTTRTFVHAPLVLPPPPSTPAAAFIGAALAAARSGQSRAPPLAALASSFAAELARCAGVPKQFCPRVTVTPAAFALLRAHAAALAAENLHSLASGGQPKTAVFESAFGPGNVDAGTGLMLPPHVSLPTDAALPTVTLSADAVVIGSGAGGGVVAATLARAGRRVLILEKGQYFAPHELTGLEEESMQALYEGKSLLTTDDGGIALLAGATVGGGTTINWACSLDLPHYVRHEWARSHALPFVASPVFSRALAAVSARVGVHAGDSVAANHNGPNTLLLRGAKALGHPASVLPQNTACGHGGGHGGKHHDCGWCSMGCRTGAKQGTQATYLKDAVQSGARIITGCYVEKILINNTDSDANTTSSSTASAKSKIESGKVTASASMSDAEAAVTVNVYGPATETGGYTTSGSDAASLLAAVAALDSKTNAINARKASSSSSNSYSAPPAQQSTMEPPPARRVTVSGVSAVVTSPHGRLRLLVSAPVVVSAAGALHSPLLLRRSGVRNPHLGTNLRLHPVVGACGFFDRGIEIDEQALKMAQQTLAANAAETDAAATDSAAPAPVAANPDAGVSGEGTAAGASEAAVFEDGMLRSTVVTREVDCFRGAIMTSIDSIVENGEGDGYGARLETPSLHPGLAAFACNWRNSGDFKRNLLSFRRLCPIIILARDKQAGTVTQGPHGHPRVTYTVSPRDQRSLTQGLIQAFHVLAAAGATRLVPPQFALDAVDIDPALGPRDPRFAALIRGIEREGVKQSRSGLFSAHQMGTCRMHGVKREGVVRPTGESWDVGNLFVADASVFPTSSGVNPMLTVLAMAQCIAAHVDKRCEQLKKWGTQAQSYAFAQSHAQALALQQGAGKEAVVLKAKL